MKVALGKCNLPFQNAVVLGILCNFLVCLGVLMAMSAKDSAGASSRPSCRCATLCCAALSTAWPTCTTSPRA